MCIVLFALLASVFHIYDSLFNVFKSQRKDKTFQKKIRFFFWCVPLVIHILYSKIKKYVVIFEFCGNINTDRSRD